MYILQNKCGNEEINLPLRIEESNVKDALEKETLLDFYMKDDKHIKCHNLTAVNDIEDEIVSELIFSNIEYKDKSNELRKVCIYYNDGQSVYQFGTSCILESMAYLIEKHIFGAEERIREFPYNANKRICEYVYPELLSSPDRIVQLCEVALFFYNRGIRFYDLTNLCKRVNFVNLTDEDFKDFCAENINKYLFEQIYMSALGGLDTLFPSKFPFTFVSNQLVKNI